MAAVHTERGREIVELESQDVLILPDSLKQLDNGMINWRDVSGKSGMAGVLPETDKRSIEAQRKYGQASRSTIGRTHSLQTPTSKSMSRIGRRFGPDRFAGILVDSGSSESLHGTAQRRAFAAHTGRPPNVRRAKEGGISSMGGKSKILASVEFGFPLNNSVTSFASLETDGDAPLLLG